MSKRDFATVGCKLLALYYFAQGAINGVINFVSWVTMFTGRFHAGRFPRPMQTNWIVPGFFIQAIIGCVFWFAADALARCIAPDEAGKP